MEKNNSINKRKNMKTIKMILISLAVLLGLFMLVGMYYGALFFFFVLKLIGAAVLIGYGIFLFSNFKYKNKE